MVPLRFLVIALFMFGVATGLRAGGPSPDDVKTYQDYIRLLGGIAAEARDTRASYPADDAFVFYTVRDGQAPPSPISWENYERANVERIVQLRALHDGAFRVYLGRDAASAYAADVFLGGGNDATLVNIGRSNRDKPGIKEYIDRTIVQAAKGRPIVIVDTSASGETFTDFILPHIPESQRSTVKLDLGLQMPSRTPRAEPLPKFPQSYAYLHYLTPERNQILMDKRRGTYKKVEKEFPHGTARSRGFTEVQGLGVDATASGFGSGMSGTEDGSVDFEQNLAIMRAMAHRLSSPAIRSQVNRRVELLRELYDFGLSTKSVEAVIGRIEMLQHLYEGDALLGMQAHFRDVIERLELDPTFREGREGRLFEEAKLKPIGLQYPFKPNRRHGDRDILPMAEIERLFFGGKLPHSAVAKRAAVHFLVEKFGRTDSSLRALVNYLKDAEAPLKQEILGILPDWRLEGLAAWADVQRVLEHSLRSGDAATARELYALLHQNRQTFAKDWSALTEEMGKHREWAARVKGADLSRKPFSVKWIDGRDLTGVSPNDILAEIEKELASAARADNVPSRRRAMNKAASHLRFWVENAKLKPIRNSDLTRLLQLANNDSLIMTDNSLVRDALTLLAERKFGTNDHAAALAALKAGATLLNHPDMEYFDPNGTLRTLVMDKMQPELNYRIRSAPRGLITEFEGVRGIFDACRIVLGSVP